MAVVSRDLFPTDDPLPTAQMIGRREDVDTLRAAIGAGLHRIVIGPRRTGKTSVCRAVLERLADDDALIVSVNLFYQADASAAAREIAAGAAAHLPALAKALRAAGRAGRAALSPAHTRVVLSAKDQLGDAVELAFESAAAQTSTPDALMQAIDLCSRVAQAREQRLVLFVDEFQELARDRFSYGDPDTITKQFRAHLEGQRGLTALLTGSAQHMMRELFTDRRRGMYRFGGFHELSAITAEDWSDGLAAAFARDKRDATGDALVRLVELGAEHPRTTMLLAQHAHLAMLGDGSRKLALEHVAVAHAGALAHDRPGHEETLARIRVMPRHTLRVALRIAHNEPPYAKGIDAKAAQRAIDSLQDEGLLEHSSASGSWRFVEPLLAEFLRTRVAR